MLIYLKREWTDEEVEKKSGKLAEKQEYEKSAKSANTIVIVRV